MTSENLLYLLLSVSFTSGRNIASKKTADDNSAMSHFFFSQAMLFLAAAILLISFSITSISAISTVTLIYGIIYGVLLISSQWMFTLALKIGSTSICSVIYSLGFIIPTVSGALFWDEEFTITDLFGLILALATIALTVIGKEKGTSNGKSFLLPIIIAMLSSGGLGIMQKVQQGSAFANERNEFLIIAFVLAFLASIIGFFACNSKAEIQKRNVIFPSLAGLCFGGANVFNTILAGRIKSAAFFPLQNISVILLSTLLGIILFKEKLSFKNIMIIILGIITVTVFSIY
ncbi:MAG: hypothetical protein J6D52_12070 [Clostridia bacterium]|nr:hypothetical protein [Clostridia bacterium]